MKLSNEQHPYYPNDWLSKQQAEALLNENGLTRHLTLTFCRRHQIEVASTGHIRKLALDSYIQREKQDEADGHVTLY